MKPSTMASKSTTSSAGGSTSDSSAERGDAPMAARSLRFTARARCPIARGRRERPIEVHALDQRVGGRHLEQVARRLDDGRIVAQANRDPGRRRRHALAHPRDQGVLADVGDATWRTQWRGSRE